MSYLIFMSLQKGRALAIFTDESFKLSTKKY